jgi:zinc/manganese transport system permease protein
MLSLGALFLSFSAGYADSAFSLLFGEVLGVSTTELWPTIFLSAACLLALAVLWRPLLLASVLPESAGGRNPFNIEVAFLLLVAGATTMTVPVVGTTLIFSLMIGPPAAARTLTAEPALAMFLSVAFAVVIAWSALALSYANDWPIGFFVGAFSAACYAGARTWTALTARR